MWIMASEPYHDISIEEAKKLFNQSVTEKELANVFAIASNKFLWVEDNIYDYKSGTAEYKRACEITDEWVMLKENIESKIFSILESKGVSIPDFGTISVLEPFMKRNGYFNGSGWWIMND